MIRVLFAATFAILLTGTAFAQSRIDVRDPSIRNEPPPVTHTPPISSAADDYRSFAFHVSSTLHETRGPSWTTHLLANRDLVAVNHDDHGRTSLAVFTWESGYSERRLAVTTPLRATTAPEWSVRFAPNGDLIAIDRDDRDRTSVRILSARSGYSEVTLRQRTALHATNSDRWELLVAPNLDLVAICRDDNGRTAVHVLNRGDRYQTFSLHSRTPLQRAPKGAWEFLIAPNRDIFIVRRDDDGRAALHVLSATSQYHEFTLHRKTALRPTDSNKWSFAMTPLRELVAINRADDGCTSLHFLSMSRQGAVSGLKATTLMHHPDHRSSMEALLRNDPLNQVNRDPASSGTEAISPGGAAAIAAAIAAAAEAIESLVSAYAEYRRDQREQAKFEREQAEESRVEPGDPIGEPGQWDLPNHSNIS